MRNLKRALSLTLASVMLLGMMVVGSSAAAGYDDVAETDNVEAIEVLQAVEVMVGDERGFGPERPVNRAEMAVVMGKLLSLDYDYYATSCPFNDVYDWARGYVGACYANKIVSGRGEGVYDPGATVTAVEAASMLMRALGYFQYANDTADGFELSTVRQGTKIGIFDGVGSSATQPMTRNQVAQMVLNALQSDTVEPDGNTINLTTPDGTVLTGKVNYVSVTRDEAWAHAINDTLATSVGSKNDGWIVELGERLYNGKLKLDDDALDPFGRPSRKWEYDGKAIGTYAKKELMVFDNVGKVVGTDLYNLLGATTLKDYDLRVAVDGIADLSVYNSIAKSVRDGANTGVVFNKTDLNRNNKAKIGATGTGVLTQVFVDHETDDIYVAIINTYLAIADKGYDEKKEEASIEVFDIDKDLSADEYAKTEQRPKDKAESEKFKLGNEDFDIVKDIEKDAAYLVTVAEGEIQTIVPAEVLSEVNITSFKRNDFVVSDGTTYNYTTTAGYKYEDLEIYTSENGTTENLKDRTYNIYLDAYGNLIGLEEVEAAKNYVFISSIDRNGSYIANKTANANAVFLDGTSDVISIDMVKSVWRDNRVDKDGNLTTAFINGDDDDGGSSLLNTWCTYTKSGDVYTVREVYNVVDASTTTLSKGATRGVAVDNGTAVTARAPEDATKTTNTTKLAQFHDVERASEITLKNGLRLNGGFTTGNNYSNIYGDSDSVYLTADLGTVRATDGKVYGIIKGADTVYTGIDGTSISIWSKQTAQKEANKDKNSARLTLDTVNASGVTTAYGDDNSYGVYTLYNDEGIIIASMIVGEGSSSKDLVYVTSSDAKLETYNGASSTRASGDGLWTWEREVVRNGEKVTLTEVGDNVDALSKDNMKNHHWYEVKTDGNGNVTKSEPAFTALDTWTANPNNSRSVFVGDYKNINTAIENEATDTVLFHQDNGNDAEADTGLYTNKGFDHTQDLEIQGKNILAVTNTQGSGIYFRNDVHVVLEYWNRNVDGIDVMVGDGVDDLKDMVDFVNENNDAALARDGGRTANTTYYLSALIENGSATTIVIYDRYNNYNRPTTGGGDSDLDAKFVTSIKITAPYVDVTRTDVVTSADVSASTEEVETWLAAQGYALLSSITDASPASGKNHSSQSVTAWKDGTPVNLIIRWTDMYTIKVNDKLVATVPYGTDLTDDDVVKVTAANLKSTYGGKGTNFKYTYSGGTGYQAYTVPFTNPGTGITSPWIFETSYINVDSSAINKTDSGNLATLAATWQNSKVKANSEQKIELTFTANPAYQNNVKVTVAYDGTSDVFTVPADTVREGGKYTVTVRLKEADVAANDITLTVEAGTSAPLVGKEIPTPNVDKNLSGLSEAQAEDALNGTTTAVQAWAMDVVRSLVRNNSGICKIDATLANAFNKCGVGAISGAADDDIAFVFDLVENKDWYILAIYDDTGKLIAAGNINATYAPGATGLAYIRPNPLAKFTDTGDYKDGSVSQLTTGKSYTWAIYTGGSNYTSLSGSWAPTDSNQKIDGDTFKA